MYIHGDFQQKDHAILVQIYKFAQTFNFEKRGGLLLGKGLLLGHIRYMYLVEYM